MFDLSTFSLIFIILSDLQKKLPFLSLYIYIYIYINFELFDSFENNTYHPLHLRIILQSS